jgi:hypothetical protein
MKLYTGWVMSAGLVLAATAAHAQTLAPYGIGRSPYAAVSDFDGPYAAVPQEAPAPRYYPYGPALLPPPEIYAIVRQSGFSPLGIPHQRGLVYIIAVIDPGGDDGRLVIDARTGRIIRFMPAYRMGDNFSEDMTATYGPVGPPPISAVRGPPRPPLPIPGARVASRTPSVPVPRAAPLRAGEVPRAGEVKPLAAGPTSAPAQQSAAVQPKPAEAGPAPAQATSPAVVEAKPAPQIQPTQEMPKVQGLE